MNNDNFMVFVYNAIIALFAFFVAAPMLLNAISLFTVQKRFAKVMVDEGVVKEETVRRLHPKKQVAGVLISLLVLAGLGWTCTRVDMVKKKAPGIAEGLLLVLATKDAPRSAGDFDLSPNAPCLCMVLDSIHHGA